MEFALHFFNKYKNIPEDPLLALWLSFSALEPPQLGLEKRVGNLHQDFLGYMSEFIIGDSLVGRCREVEKISSTSPCSACPFELLRVGVHIF